MRKWIRLLIGLMACCALAYSVHQMVVFGMEAGANSRLIDTLTTQVVTFRPPSGEPRQEPEQSQEIRESREPREPRELPPIQVDFESLAKQGSGVIGWLYCQDTPINLPVAQSDDNRYYLRRLLDGTENNAGTLFADYRGSRDFSDWNTVVYGHNMRNGTMFGTLHRYEKQAYYDAHPAMWLLTSQGDYKVELVAGLIASATSEFYSFPEEAEEAEELARQAMERSTFVSDFTPAPGDKYLTLSTCSYEFDDARYILIGRLVPAGE